MQIEILNNDILELISLNLGEAEFGNFTGINHLLLWSFVNKNIRSVVTNSTRKMIIYTNPAGLGTGFWKLRQNWSNIDILELNLSISSILFIPLSLHSVPKLKQLSLTCSTFLGRENNNFVETIQNLWLEHLNRIRPEKLLLKFNFLGMINIRESVNNDRKLISLDYLKTLVIDNLFLTILSESVNSLCILPNLIELKIFNLELSEGNISPNLVEFFINLKNLKRLSLENSWISFRFWDLLAEMKNLEELEITRPLFNINFIFDNDFINTTKNIFSNLKTLSLENCLINRGVHGNGYTVNQNLFQFCNIIKDSKLQKLTLSGNRINLCEVKDCSNCNNYNFSSRNVCWDCQKYITTTEETNNLLDSIKYNGNIREVDLFGNCFTYEEGFKRNSEFNEFYELAKQYPELTYLNKRKLVHNHNDNLECIISKLETTNVGFLITDNIIINNKTALLNYYLNFLINFSSNKNINHELVNMDLVNKLSNLLKHKDKILKIEVGNKSDINWIIPTFDKNSIIFSDSDIVVTQWLLAGLKEKIDILILNFQNLLPTNLYKAHNIFINLEISNDLSLIGQFHNQLYSSGDIESLIISLSIINTRAVQDLEIRQDIVKCLLTDLLVYNSIKKLTLIVNEPLKNETFNIIKNLINNSMLSLSQFNNKITIM